MKSPGAPNDQMKSHHPSSFVVESEAFQKECGGQSLLTSSSSGNKEDQAGISFETEDIVDFDYNSSLSWRQGISKQVQHYVCLWRHLLFDLGTRDFSY